MTSWFIGVKASVISGAPLYSKSISYLFPVGKRQVLFAKRSYIEKFGVEPVHRQQKSGRHPPVAFLFYGGPSGVQPAPQATAAALSRLARCAGKRSRVSSAPRPFGFEPMQGRQKKRPTGVDRFLFYGGPSGVQPAPQAAAAALSRLARCAGKRSRVYSAPRPDGFEPVHRQQKSDQPEPIAFFSMVGRQGFEPWTLGLKVPCSAS